MELTGATEAVAQAYAHVLTIRGHFKNSKESPKVREALRFLSLNARPDESNLAAIDCMRCLSFALAVLHGAPEEFTDCYTDFWNTCGALTGAVLRGYSENRGDIAPAVSIGWFSDQYNDATWPTRSNIVAGFMQLVKTSTYRDDTFWEAVSGFQESCEKEVQEPPWDTDMPAALSALLNLWGVLTHKFGTSEQVRERMVTNAGALFELIIKTGRHKQTDCLPVWKGALLDLSLTVVDPMVDRYPSSDRDSIKESLNKIIRMLKEHCEPRSDAILHNWFKAYRKQLMPYLQGRIERPVRLALPAQERSGQAAFRSASSDEVSRRITLEDICQRTYRGFRIEVDELSVPEPYDETMGLNGRYVEGRPCRTVPCTSDLTENFPVEEVDLTFVRTVNGLPREFVFHCGVLRAWPLTTGGSGWALFAPPDTVDVPDWRDYITAKLEIT